MQRTFHADVDVGSSEGVFREFLAIGAVNFVVQLEHSRGWGVTEEVFDDVRALRQNSSGSGGSHINKESRHLGIGADLSGLAPSTLIVFVFDSEGLTGSKEKEGG